MTQKFDQTFREDDKMAKYASHYQFAVDSPPVSQSQRAASGQQENYFHNDTRNSHSWLRPLQWAAIAKERRALKKLDHDQLLDIGVSKFDATMESDKHRWDVPQHWHN